MIATDFSECFAREAHRQRPRLPRDEEAFAAWMKSKRLDPGAIPTNHAGDLLLVWACERGDRVALEIFETELVAPLRGPWHAIVDEVRQRVRVQLLLPRPDGSLRLGRYRGSGSLRGWVGVVARRLASRPVRALAEVTSPHPIDDPEAVTAQRQELARFKMELETASTLLSERERVLLRAHYLERKSLDEVAGEHGVSRATAGRWIVDARARLRRQLSAGAAPSLPADELSLSRILARPPR